MQLLFIISIFIFSSARPVDDDAMRGKTVIRFARSRSPDAIEIEIWILKKINNNEYV